MAASSEGRAFAVAAGLGGLVAIRSVLPAGTPRVRGRAGLATLERVRIGDCDQWILERSEDVANPVVLFLHGGPGTSQLTSNRRNTRHLEKYFTVVNWDQRGAGKSYRAIGDAGRMNIDQFVADTRELTRYLLAKFGQERLILAGHSWGSVIAALTVSRYPELYHCYVGIGQVARMAEGEAASYRWTLEQARKHRDGRAIRALEQIGPPPYPGDWQRKTVTERRYVARFGGEVHASRNGAFGLVIRGPAVVARVHHGGPGRTTSGESSAPCGCCGPNCSRSTCSRRCRRSRSRSSSWRGDTTGNAPARSPNGTSNRSPRHPRS